MTKTYKSEVEIAESTVEGRVEMAAAEASLDTVGLLNRVLRASGLSQREIAEALGVGESRVSQVLTGDGNLKITTLARYLRAAGYALKLEAVPVDAAAKELPRPRSRSRRDADVLKAMTADLVKCWESPVLGSLGVGKAYTFLVNEGTGHEIVSGQRASIDPEKFHWG
ncbi:helix-turn-helix domain-containing protein [Arthrobacter sp. H16F315]|uniref:helix-turn-helix domain-containing protein n=1 Tax=Arthrobacter sp. H16F315 TaxID=2955314 RepID=UPI00209788FA|nr:helix-turn-helix transcriptional regulator [Arthrobacter sp. H16F315]MDD1477071.1 helix-turn-helix transcriptional regulator [Arthrobacter sp. H16F315]